MQCSVILFRLQTKFKETSNKMTSAVLHNLLIIYWVKENTNEPPFEVEMYLSHLIEKWLSNKYAIVVPVHLITPAGFVSMLS